MKYTKLLDLYNLPQCPYRHNHVVLFVDSVRIGDVICKMGSIIGVIEYVTRRENNRVKTIHFRDVCDRPRKLYVGYFYNVSYITNSSSCVIYRVNDHDDVIFQRV